MKKLLILLLALVMCLTVLTSCEKVLGIFFNPVEPQPEVEYNVNSAAAFIEEMYGGEANVIQPADYKVTTKAPYAGVAYDVTWTVDNDKIKIETIEGDANNVLINVPEKSPEEITYKLTATVTAPNGDKATVSFDRKVLQYNVTSFEDYINGEKGETVTIEGIVVAMNSKSLGNKRNHIFLADAEGKGGYYSYQMDQDPIADLGIEVGMTVSVTGPLSPYAGMQEISGGTATIVDKTIKTVPPMDITALVESGASLKNYAGLVVTIKNVDVVGGQSLADPNHQYLYFEKGNTVSYVRTYQTDLIHTIVGVEGAKERIEADHLAHQDYTANVTGVLVLYDGNPYIIPMSETPFEWLEYVPKTPEYKVNKEFNNLTFDSSFNSDTVVDLKVKGKNYSDVIITWESNNANAVVADGKLTVTVPETDTTIKLTATITCEGQTKTKEFEVTLSRKPISIADALELADGANVYVAGEVVEINTAWSDQYGNITVTISDGENTLYVYRMKTNVVVGDVIEIRGVMGSYNGKKQIAQGSEAVITDHAPVEATAAEAKALEDGRRVIVTGTVTQINTAWSEQYKNITVTITDDNGDTLYIYRLATNVKVGDYIKITGRVGSHNGSKQIAQGATAELTEKGETPELEHECESKCEFCGKCKDAECAEDACTKKCPGCTAVVSPEVVTAPAANTAYKFFMVQKNVNKVLYLTGEMDGNYLATTENVDEAIDVYVEVVDGGYKLSLTKDGTKSYLAIVSKVSGDKTYYNAVFTAEGSVFTFNTEYNTFVTVVNETEYVFGTDARPGYTYKTFGANKAQYMSTTFVAHLTLAEAGEAPAHKCESVCPVEGCGKCLDAACTEDACTEKCQGHPVTIAKVLEGKVGDSYLTTGTVVAVNGRGFILRDETGAILVYLNKAPAVALGDTVTVKGATSTYNKGVQFGDTAVVTKTGTATVDHGTAAVLTADDLTAYKSATAITPKYVELTGKLVVDGNYYNILVDGTEAQGSLKYLAGDLKTATDALNGWTIKVTGYAMALSGGKYVDIMVTSVEAVSVDVTVYFKNVDNWAKVSAWIWTSSENFTGGTWPGKAATAVEGADGWYSYTFTATSSIDGLKLIFNNNNNGSQTSDLSYDAAKCWWYKNTAYATQADADKAHADDIAANVQYSEWYLRGEMNSWGTSDRLQLNEDGTASIVITLEANKSFKIATSDWSKEFNWSKVTDTTNFANAGGNIKVVTAGTYKFVVSADGSTLTITPVKEEAPVQTTVSTTIEAYKTANGWTNETKHTELVLDENVKVTVSGGSNTGKYYDSGFEWRVYQTESPSITVTAVEGKKIVSVKIKYNVKNSGVLTQGETQIKSNTVVEVNANSVTFGVGNSSTKTNGQVKITGIEVVYE